jgi:hypothetical protein
MRITIRLIFIPIFVCITLLQACSGVRLQHKNEAINELNKSAQAVAERQCQQYSSPEYQDCMRNVREAYEEQRRKNLENIR